MEKKEFSLQEVSEMSLTTKVFVVNGFEINEYYLLGFVPGQMPNKPNNHVLFSDDLELFKSFDLRTDNTVFYLEWKYAVEELIRKLKDRLNFIEKNWL